MDLLKAGQTPIDLYNSGVSVDSLYGKPYGGGLIFYLNTTTGEGLVSAPVDQSAGAEWGCWDNEIGGTSIAIGTGQANTTAIVNGCSESGIAARHCDDLVYGGYVDWFLPSKDELNLMWENLADSDGNGVNTGATDSNNLGGFANENYWSSTEVVSELARLLSFSGGVHFSIDKNSMAYVRAVRAF